jgi:adenylylsulfate kinase
MRHIKRYKAIVSKKDRNLKNDHKSIVLWFTGLSGSGKSTLAYAIEDRLYQGGYQTYVLDGDNVRHGLSSDLGFSEADRKENMRRIGEVSKLMIDAGIVTLASFISPFRKDRLFVRRLMSQGDFLEIYCKATLATCERRDVKGFYKKARLGEIENYTGIDSPYEAPKNAELEVDTDKLSVEESVDLVLQLLIQRKIIKRI